METPLNPLVADIVNRLDSGLREDFEERAAIMEFEANMDRAYAECLALLDVLRRHPSVLHGLTVLRAEVGGATQCLLATDPDRAHRHLADNGGVEVVVLDLADTVELHYGGIAVLAPLK